MQPELEIYTLYCRAYGKQNCRLNRERQGASRRFCMGCLGKSFYTNSFDRFNRSASGLGTGMEQWDWFRCVVEDRKLVSDCRAMRSATGAKPAASALPLTWVDPFGLVRRERDRKLNSDCRAMRSATSAKPAASALPLTWVDPSDPVLRECR